MARDNDVRTSRDAESPAGDASRDEGITVESVEPVAFAFKPDDGDTSGSRTDSGSDHPTFGGEPRGSGAGSAYGSSPASEDEAPGLDIPTIKGPKRPSVEVQAWGGFWQVLFGIIAQQPRRAHWQLSFEEAYGLGEASAKATRRFTKYLPKRHAGWMTEALQIGVVMVGVVGPRVYADAMISRGQPVFRAAPPSPNGTSGMSATEQEALRAWQVLNSQQNDR